MSSGRLALILTLGLATYLASQESDRKAARNRTRTPPPRTVAEAPLPTPTQTPPVFVTPPQAMVKLHPVIPLDQDPAPPAPPAPSPISAPSAPPSPPAPPGTSAEDHAALAAQVEMLERKFADLAGEVERLRDRYVGSQQVASRRSARSARPISSRGGRLEPSAGAAPILAPSPAAVDPGDILGLDKVTDTLMRRLERLER